MDEPNKEECLLEKNPISDEDELRLVVNGKNLANCEYLAEMLKSKFDGIEVQTLSREEFEKNFNYSTPYGNYKHDMPTLRKADLVEKTDISADEVSTDFFVCQVCGEQVTSTGHLEWHVKAKHTLSHLKYQTKFKCYRCGFLCSLALPMYKHIPIAHNNNTSTDIYPLFEEEKDMENFNARLLECFPSTQCLSTLQSDTDFRTGKSAHLMYYALKMSTERGESTATTCFVVPSLPIKAPQQEKPYPEEKDDSPYLRMTCSLCDFETKSAQFMENHMSSEHPPRKPSTCKQCGYIASNRRIMIDHLKLCRRPEKAMAVLDTCQTCGFTSENYQLLLSHIEIAHKDTGKWRTKRTVASLFNSSK